MGRGCAKTPAFDLRVESSSRFDQSENQKFWRELSEEGNRENDSTLSWLAHVFTRPGPFADVACGAKINHFAPPGIALKRRVLRATDARELSNERFFPEMQVRAALS